MTAVAAGHLVQFYEDGDRLAQSLTTVLADPLMRGETVVVVAAADHRNALDSALADAGVNLTAERRSGRYVSIDVDEAMASFMTRTGPDHDLFRSAVGSTIEEGRRRTGTVHA